MNVSKLTAALLALLVVSTGVGAVAGTPGNGNAPDDAGTNAANAPAEEANANATDARDEGTSSEEAEDRSADAADAADTEERRGPPADLPEQVPDHVGEIHQRIVSFLDGELDSLGAAVSDVTPADDSEEAETDGDAEAATNADAEADGDSTETATATSTTEA